MKFLQDLEIIKILRVDVSFVFYESKSAKKKNKQNPYVVSGDDFFKNATEKINCQVVSEMKLGIDIANKICFTVWVLMPIDNRWSLMIS